MTHIFPIPLYACEILLGQIFLLPWSDIPSIGPLEPIASVWDRSLPFSAISILMISPQVMMTVHLR